MSIELIVAGLLQGLFLAFIALGIMIPLRFLNFADLSAEGAYPLGGAVCARLIMAHCPCWLSILVGTLAGGVLAMCAAHASIKLKINSLLSGILLSSMAYSINLRIIGQPNVALFNFETYAISCLILVGLLSIIGIFLYLFLYTDFGLRLRAVGINPSLAYTQGINIDLYSSLGLLGAGSLFGLAGSLVVHNQQFMDVGMGIGVVIHGLAALMIGESIVGTHTLQRQLLAPVIGALLYQQLQGLALSMGLAPSDLKFFTSIFVILLLALQPQSKYFSK